MEKEINFRIIELPTHQVLLTRDFDNEDKDQPVITITFFLDGVKVKQSLGYNEESKRDEYFNKITDKLVQQMLDNCLKLFGS